MNRWLIATTLLTISLSMPVRAQDAVPAGELGTATIKGAVTLTTAAPAAAGVEMGSDPQCAAHAATTADDLVVDGNGGVQWAFVHVSEGVTGKYPVPKKPVLLDQEGCMYSPHVFGAQVRQKILIKNSDAMLHNVHAMPEINREFNLAMPKKDMQIPRKFKKPEVMVHIKCDVHSWMHSYVGVTTHPFYAVSGADGAFSIGELPAGTYTVQAWHETLGTATQQVTVVDGGTADVNFAFGG